MAPRRIPSGLVYLLLGLFIGGLLIHLRSSGHEIAQRVEGTKATLRAHSAFSDRMVVRPLPRSRALEHGPNEQTIFDDMIEWLLLNGAKLPLFNRTRIGLVDKGPVQVRGFVTTAPIHAPAVLAQIPERVMLSRESLLQTPMRVPILRERISIYVSLVLAILYEMKQAKDAPYTAPWAPYMRFLSTVSLETPAMWPPERVAKATPVLQKLLQMTMKAQELTYNALRARAPDALALCGSPSLETFRRAWEMAASRFWLMRDRAFIAPYADMLNFGEHNNTCDVVARDPAGYLVRSAADVKASLAATSFEFYIVQNYTAGDEIMFYYNKHCAEEFQVYYGFTYPPARPCTQERAGKYFWFKRNLRGGYASITD